MCAVPVKKALWLAQPPAACDDQRAGLTCEQAARGMAWETSQGSIVLLRIPSNSRLVAPGGRSQVGCPNPSHVQACGAAASLGPGAAALQQTVVSASAKTNEEASDLLCCSILQAVCSDLQAKRASGSGVR